MLQISRPITENRRLSPSLWQLTVSLEQQDDAVLQMSPGQFFLVRCPDPQVAYLRRAFFPANIVREHHRVGNQHHHVQFLVSATELADPVMAWLVSRQPGERLDLLGPLGHGFATSTLNNRYLLFASGPKPGPILFLMHFLIEQKKDVVLAIETDQVDDLFPTHLIPTDTEIRVSTMDGKVGNTGSILAQVTDLFPWADTICATGPLSFYEKLKASLDQTRLELLNNFVNVLIDTAPLHICGVGICRYCTIPTQTGSALACLDGPVFDLGRLTPSSLEPTQ